MNPKHRRSWHNRCASDVVVKPYCDQSQMKRRILSAICVIGLAAWANATVVTFVPPDPSSRDSNLHDMEDLDHDYYYSWGIDWSLPSGNTIQEAVLTISNIRDWTVEQNLLHIHLLPTAPSGVQRVWDGQGMSDAFDPNNQGNPPLIGRYSDPDGPATRETLVYRFSDLGLLDDLAQFLADGNFGIGFDPDCHFYNNGVTFQITVPDGGMTMMLLGSALIGLEGLRRKLRK